MSNETFFEERTEESEVKTEIVRKYFWAWAKIISKQVKKSGNSKIGYVDLFAGQGRYEDNSKSTPLLILEGAIRDEEIRKMLVTWFNDSELENSIKLEEEIKQLQDINLLKHKPIITSFKVNDSLAEQFDKMKTIPTLYFLDPWGYKGLSLKLVKATIQCWGCDCMFFFNYNRINAALSNPVMNKNMNSFFGKIRADELRNEIANKPPRERENLIINGLKETLSEFGGKFSVEYFFKDDSGKKTSHFLIFVCKHPLGYNIMKGIMAKESSDTKEGVASFGFSPKDKNKQLSLFDSLYSPIDELAEDLLNLFAGQTISVKELFHKHHIGKNYILKNYQDALRKLEEQGKIIVNPPAIERRQVNGIVTFSENIIVTFPEK